MLQFAHAISIFVSPYSGVGSSTFLTRTRASLGDPSAPFDFLFWTNTDCKILNRRQSRSMYAISRWLKKSFPAWQAYSHGASNHHDRFPAWQ